MKINIPEFEDFVDSDISGRIIINPYWLEYLLSLFYQGYIAEVQIEIWDTQHNIIRTIDDVSCGIIGNELV